MAINVILLEKMGRLGELGDQVAVKNGFARNYLLPQGKAVIANSDNIAKFQVRRLELEKIVSEKKQEAQSKADAIKAISQLTISTKTAEEGRLYGSVGAKEIIKVLNEQGISVEKTEIQFPHGALRQLGEHEIEIQLYSDVKVTVKVVLVAENS